MINPVDQPGRAKAKQSKSPMILSGFNKDAHLLNESFGLPKLTYCTNIHTGASWDDVLESLHQCVPSVRSQLDVESLGIGLRLSAEAVQSLQLAANREDLSDFTEKGYPVFTVNAFPYGAFHGEPVKSRVYAPDWSTPERLEYTQDVARLLATLNQPGSFASISTVPGTFKQWDTPELRTAITQNLLLAVAELARIERDTGVHIALALEPEPCCMLETIAEAIAWFNEAVLSPTAREKLASLCKVDLQVSETLIRRHLGICYDVCHAAVEFENPAGSLQMLEAAGISIPKIQLSSALRVACVDESTLKHLSAFDEPVYLHQVVQSSGDTLTRFVDLPEALEQRVNALGSEWRIHFHVPVFIEQLAHFDTTQFFLKEVLAYYRQNPCSPHLEVETYTWDVLPADLRTTDISSAIARELDWVRNELLSEIPANEPGAAG